MVNGVATSALLKMVRDCNAASTPQAEGRQPAAASPALDRGGAQEHSAAVMLDLAALLQGHALKAQPDMLQQVAEAFVEVARSPFASGAQHGPYPHHTHTTACQQQERFQGMDSDGRGVRCAQARQRRPPLQRCASSCAPSTGRCGTPPRCCCASSCRACWAWLTAAAPPAPRHHRTPTRTSRCAPPPPCGRPSLPSPKPP